MASLSFQTITVLAGFFLCQQFSVASKFLTGNETTKAAGTEIKLMNLAGRKDDVIVYANETVEDFQKRMFFDKGCQAFPEVMKGDEILSASATFRDVIDAADDSATTLGVVWKSLDTDRDRAEQLFEKVNSGKVLNSEEFIQYHSIRILGFAIDKLKDIKTLPCGLHTLTFGYSFDQPLDYPVELPDSLQALTFGEKFNQSLDHVRLPASLQALKFGNDFNHSLENVTFPPELQTLTFGHRFNQPLKAERIPAGLHTDTVLNKLRRYFLNSPVEYEYVNVKFPDSLKKLTFGQNFNQPLDKEVKLPGSLQALTFGENFNQPLDNIEFPGDLRKLTFGKSFNQSLDKVTFPDKLRALRFGKNFKQPLDNVNFPDSLRTVTFGRNYRDYKQSLKNVSHPLPVTWIDIRDGSQRFGS